LNPFFFSIYFNDFAPPIYLGLVAPTALQTCSFNRIEDALIETRIIFGHGRIIGIFSMINVNARNDIASVIGVLAVLPTLIRSDRLQVQNTRELRSVILTKIVHRYY